MKNKHFYLNEETLNYINDLKNKYKLSSASKTLEKIIEEHKEFSNSYNQKEIENTEINTQIIIEMLNCFLINNVKDSDSFIKTDDFKSPILEMAKETVQNRIYKNFYEDHKKYIEKL